MIIPTLRGEGTEFERTLASIVRCDPACVLVVTPQKNVNRLEMEIWLCKYTTVRVVGVEIASKRFQMVQGLRHVRTPITIFADDDVSWPITFLPMFLAPFEDPKCGAAGSCQRLHRETNPNIWNILGAVYLERRNFEISATTHLDGGTSALSGRTQAVRTHIVQNEAFVREFLTEKWLGIVNLLHADDDNFLTRWMVNNDWKIKIQYCKEAEITTTLANSPRFIFQCVRWYRTIWRSNITSMFVDRRIWM